DREVVKQAGGSDIVVVNAVHNDPARPLVDERLELNSRDLHHASQSRRACFQNGWRPGPQPGRSAAISSYCLWTSYPSSWNPWTSCPSSSCLSTWCPSTWCLSSCPRQARVRRRVPVT